MYRCMGRGHTDIWGIYWGHRNMQGVYRFMGDLQKQGEHRIWGGYRCMGVYRCGVHTDTLQIYGQCFPTTLEYYISYKI